MEPTVNALIAETGSIERLAELADDFGSELLAAEARALAERIAEGRFFVACVGQFKRGKSTLLDALVGEAVLPTGVVPITTAPTVVRYGDQRAARVQTEVGKWTNIPLDQVEQYVSEEHNPENVKGVTAVEVFVPSPLLASGMCFVDTPGLGSVFAGNTATTHAFIPHIDAAIVVIGADPPLSGEELSLVESVAQHVQDQLIVVNKVDRVTDDEREAATAFARRLLESKLRRSVGPIFAVSAIERLEQRGPERDWPLLLHQLESLDQESGHSLTRGARDRGLRRLVDTLLRILEEERRALVRPVQESGQRISTLRHTVADAERSMMDLGYLFIAEQHRLSRTFEERRTEFLEKTRPIAHEELKQAIAQIHRRSGPAFRVKANRHAQEIARGHLGPWLESEGKHAEQAYRAIAQRFVNIGNDFLTRLAAAGVPEFADMPRALDAEQGFRTRSRFYFHDLIEIARPASPIRFLLDLALGLVGALGSIKQQTHQFLDHLLETNTMRVRTDVEKRVNDGRSRLETDIRILLHEVSAVAERALKHARETQAAGAPAVETALRRIAAIESEVRRLRPADTQS